MCGGLLPVAAQADDAQSTHYALKTSAVSTSGDSSSTAQTAIAWGTTGEPAGQAATSLTYQLFGAFPAQVRQWLFPGPNPFNDTIPPTISHQIPQKKSFVNTRTPVIGADYADEPGGSGIDVASVRVWLDGVDATSQAMVFGAHVAYTPFPPLSGDLHAVQVSVSDRAGNHKQSEWLFSVDVMPPSIFNVHPLDVVGAARPSISAEFKDYTVNPNVPPGDVPDSATSGIDTAGIRLALDGLDVTGQTSIKFSPMSYTPATNLTEGPHAITLIVPDHAGNVQRQTWGFEVDLTPPIVYLTTPVDQQAVHVTTLEASGVADDLHLAGVTVNGAAAVLTQKTFTATLNLVEGSNTIQVVATDRGGNQRTQTITVIRDTVPPVVTITSPSDQAVMNQTSVSVQGTIDDPTATVFLSGLLPAIRLTPTTWRALGVSLALGANQLEAKAFDPAGNEAAASVTVNVTTQTEAISLSASPQSGIPPLSVTFTPTTPLASITAFQYDWEGNGTVDATSATAAPVNHVYSAVELYQPSVTVQTSSGELFSASTTVTVHEPATSEGSVAVTDPVDVEVDAAGLIYVLLRSPSQIQVFRFDKPTMSFVLQKTIPGAWASPEGFALTSSLALFIADTSNHRIQKLIPDAQGTYALDPSFGAGGIMGSFGAGPGQFNRPVDVAVDEDDALWVSDQLNHRLQKFSGQGNLLGTFGTMGSSVGELNTPAGITYSPLTRRILVADAGNHRVQFIDRDGVFEQAVGTLGVSQGQLNAPAGVSADQVFDQLAVADTGNNRVQLWSPSGVFAQELTGLGLSGPRAVAPPPLPANQMIPERLLYIADTGNNRVLRVIIPQGASADDPLAPYYALIAALQANNVEAATATYVTEKQHDRRAFFDMLRVNHTNGLVPLGQEMAQSPTPVLVQRMGDEALYVAMREEDGKTVEYDLFIHREQGQWKLLQF